jgi:L-alanine-DL-glutamate epimerase-like enolase superfamily enzyme
MKYIRGDIKLIMRITSFDYIPIQMSLESPYSIAYETIKRITNVFIRIKTSNGIIGYGCAAPDKAITGETSNSVVTTLEKIVIPSLLDANPLRSAKIIEKISNKTNHSNPSVLAAVDMALYDILGKVANLPLWILLGGYRSSIKTSVTIGIMDKYNTTKEAINLVNQGFKCLKIKGGLDVSDDIERVNEIRKTVGNTIEIRFDANQGYNIDDSLKFIKETKNTNLELIEQPTPSGEIGLLEKITNEAPLPIMADESLMNLRDAFRLARKDVVDMVNVKLMKVGGISNALQINAVAKSAGLEVMVGCMDESELSISAGLHFALSRPNILYADLDGHLGLINDPSKGSFNLKKGILYPNDTPGLGLNSNILSIFGD